MTIARQKRKISGFTLIEIIIVIAVLGILAMIARRARTCHVFRNDDVKEI